MIDVFHTKFRRIVIRLNLSILSVAANGRHGQNMPSVCECSLNVLIPSIIRTIYPIVYHMC